VGYCEQIVPLLHSTMAQTGETLAEYHTVLSELASPDRQVLWLVCRRDHPLDDGEIKTLGSAVFCGLSIYGELQPDGSTVGKPSVVAIIVATPDDNTCIVTRADNSAPAPFAGKAAPPQSPPLSALTGRAVCLKMMPDMKGHTAVDILRVPRPDEACGHVTVPLHQCIEVRLGMSLGSSSDAKP
jgi:hypothetical protein